MNSLKWTSLLALSVIVGLSGCSSDDKGNGPDTPDPFSILRLDLYDTAPLPAEFAYQLWLLPTPTMSTAATAWAPQVQFRTLAGLDGQPDTLVTIDGERIAQNTFADLSVDFADFDSLLITIEADAGLAGTPSATQYLRADIPANLDLVSIAGCEFPVDLEGRSGNFALLSPTDTDSLNENSGLWFLRGFQPPVSGLNNLPVTTAGWKYEGWVYHAGIWLSTGKFTDPEADDEFDGFSESANPPLGIPGEDFLVNAPAGTTFPWVLLDSDSVAVSIEPDPDPSPNAPFKHRFLLSDIADPFTISTLPFVNNSLPAGNADFNRPETE